MRIYIKPARLERHRSASTSELPDSPLYSAQTYTENCVLTLYEKIVTGKVTKLLILLEAGSGIEPVYTDSQWSAPL